MRMLVLLLLAAPLWADPAALLKEGDAAFRKRRWATARPFYEQAYAEAMAAKQTTIAVEASAQVARCLLLRNKSEQGLPWLEKAKTLASEKDPVGWSRYLSVLGRYQWKDEKLAEATRTFISMYAFCLATKQFDRAVDAAHMVAITGKPEQQVVWAHKGIAAAEKGGHEGWLGPLWNNLGVTHQERGDWKSALECYRKARGYHWRLGGEVNKLAAELERVIEAQKLLKRAHTRLENANMNRWDPKAWKELNARIAALKNPK